MDRRNYSMEMDTNNPATILEVERGLSGTSEFKKYSFKRYDSKTFLNDHNKHSERHTDE